MAKKINLIGKKYGKLTVIEEIEERNKQGKILYKCICECGNECIVKAINLTTGKTKSCGCSQHVSKIKDSDFIGKKFGEFTVIKFSHINNKNVRMYLCKCSCGNEVVVNCYNLKNGKSTNCGCKRKNNLSKILKKDLTGKKFGKLTVIKFIGVNKNKKNIYECKCECGGRCIATSQSLTTGHTSSCGCINSSGNMLIEQCIRKFNVKYIKEYHININTENIKFIRYDFYLPDLKIAIEYDGEQHYFPVNIFGGEKKFLRQKELDEFKNKYCINNNITLIRIPYYEKKNIPNIINKILSPTTTERNELISNNGYATVCTHNII